jgi:hypothetical protein
MFAAVCLLFLFIFGVLCSRTVGNPCTDACDEEYYQSGIPVKFCGTDNITYQTYYEAVSASNACYGQCGIMAQYAGSCECPNNCMEANKQGACLPLSLKSSAFHCVCGDGWGGRDCSLPIVKNDCSLHGKLIKSDDTKSRFPFDYCECNEGFTGIDCSSLLLDLPVAPWGDIFSDSPEYTEEDKFQDDHPIFNLSLLTTIRINIPEEDYVNLLLPENLYNETYASATVYFDNGDNIQQVIEQVGMKVKGSYSRRAQKKNWTLKFNEFVKDQSLGDGILTKMGLKGVDPDPTVRARLYGDLYRAVGGPTSRSSYALLYVNEIFLGIYIIHEEIDTDFVTGRISDDQGKGNLMKFSQFVYLGYFGDDLSYYENEHSTNVLGGSQYYYEQSQGDGNWTDFISWLSILQQTAHNDDPHQQKKTLDNLKEIVHVDLLLKSMVVESFLLANDNMGSANNYYAYHRTSKKHSNQFVVFDFDFDACLYYNSRKQFYADTDIMGFWNRTFGEEDDPYNNVNPLIFSLLQLRPDYRADYLTYYGQFLRAVFADSLSPDRQPSQRFASLMQWTLPWISKDLLWTVGSGWTASDFVSTSEYLAQYLNQRYVDVAHQIEYYKSVV